MAFGFAQAAGGLIAAGDTVGAAGRFRLDFARAYVDRLVIAPGARVASPLPQNDENPLPGPASLDEARGHPLLLFGDTLAGTSWAGAVDTRHVPSFPDEALRHAGPSGASPTGQVPSTARRVCLFGPESTGKSTLAEALAAHYRCPLAHEYARAYLDAIGSPGTRDDVPWIARGQRATEAAAALQAGPLLICDTNLATIALWSDILYGETPDWIHGAAMSDHYDLWLLTDIDVPYAADPQRCFPDPGKRSWFMDECRRTLARLEVVPVVLRGDPATRLATARAAIDSL